MCSGLLHERAVPRAGERRRPQVRGAQRELDLLRGRRPLPRYDPARLQGGGQEVEETIRCL